MPHPSNQFKKGAEGCSGHISDAFHGVCISLFHLGKVVSTLPNPDAAAVGQGFILATMRTQYSRWPAASRVQRRSLCWPMSSEQARALTQVQGGRRPAIPQRLKRLLVPFGKEAILAWSPW